MQVRARSGALAPRWGGTSRASPVRHARGSGERGRARSRPGGVHFADDQKARSARTRFVLRLTRTDGVASNQIDHPMASDWERVGGERRREFKRLAAGRYTLGMHTGGRHLRGTADVPAGGDAFVRLAE